MSDGVVPVLSKIVPIVYSIAPGWVKLFPFRTEVHPTRVGYPVWEGTAALSVGREQ
jgi:hypothetical protein